MQRSTVERAVGRPRQHRAVATRLGKREFIRLGTIALIDDGLALLAVLDILTSGLPTASSLFWMSTCSPDLLLDSLSIFSGQKVTPA
jgi:hypothetical protein